jgi:site-specific recombinase XerD
MSDIDLPSTLVGPLLQSFFTEHMLSHRRASQQTVDSYRDTFRLLLRFLQQTAGKEPARLRISDLDAPSILNFLDHVEQQRKNQIQSRNVRLAAIRSFFRLVALRDPASVHIVTRVLAIPLKRADKRLVGYLTRAEMDAILCVPDRKTWGGQRDYTLLLTFYNSGARVSEITSLKRSQIRLGATSFLQMVRGGRKERSRCGRKPPGP